MTALVYWATALAKLWRYDVIHAYSASYWSYVVCVVPIVLIGRLYRKKVLLNYHSGEADDHLSHWGSLIRLCMNIYESRQIAFEFVYRFE